MSGGNLKKLLFVLFLLSCTNAYAKLNVVTSTSDLASIASEIAGDLAHVKSIARGDQDPHFLEAKPSYVVLLHQADLLIDIGLDLEIGWLPLLVDQARNPKINTGQLGRMTAAAGLALLEIPTGPVDRSMGDVHSHGNPHYMLDPRNALVVAKNISERLQSIDPEHADHYKKNLQTFSEVLQKKILQWELQAKPFKSMSVVSHHRSFSYFFNWLTINAVDYIEPKPGISPPPSHLLSLIDKVSTSNVKIILVENYYDPRPAKELASKTGVPMLHLPAAVGATDDIKSYIDLFDHLLNEIQGAL